MSLLNILEMFVACCGMGYVGSKLRSDTRFALMSGMAIMAAHLVYVIIS